MGTIALALVFVVFTTAVLIAFQRWREKARARKKIKEARDGKEEREYDEGESWTAGAWSILSVAIFVVSALVGFLSGRIWFLVASLLLALTRLRAGKAQTRLNILLAAKKAQSRVNATRAALAASTNDPRRMLDSLDRLEEGVEEEGVKNLCKAFKESFPDSVSKDWVDAVQNALRAKYKMLQGRGLIGDIVKARWGEALFVSAIGFVAIWVLVLAAGKYITPGAEGMYIVLQAFVAVIYTLLDEMSNV